MREQVIKVVEKYIDAVLRNDEKSLPLRADIVFEGPLATVRGMDEFREGLAKFIPALKGIKIVRLTADDETCAAVLELNTIYGVIPFLEYFRVDDGLIYAIRAYYDPRPILEGIKAQSVSSAADR